MTNTNPSDPKFWEAVNITPIKIDPNNPESMVEGGKEIARRINEFLGNQPETSPPPSNPTDNPLK